MRIIWGYIKLRIWAVVLLGLWTAVWGIVLYLYGTPVEAAGYGALLCGVALAVFGAVDFWRYRQKVLLLESLEGKAALLLDQLPDTGDPREQAYQDLLHELDDTRRAVATASDAWKRETTYYYTMWVHQIKTPIAAMRLMLQGDESEQGRNLAAELFRVERYAELALSYLRLDGGGTDYLVREVSLDQVLRQAVRKYAPLFIRGKVSLDLRETGLRVLTDEKWLQLVVEQVLSNAVKYAPSGHVKVWSEGTDLFIQDDGVGIAGEDLPRIFEHGFTGCNGRLDKRSTGIGLFLCSEICKRLGHTISVDSELGKGTRVTIGLQTPELEVE